MATLSYDDFPRSAAEERELRKSLGKSGTNWPAPIVDASQRDRKSPTQNMTDY